MNLQPQSGRTLQPNQRDGIAQNIRIQGVAKGMGNQVKMRWKANYAIGGQSKEEQGMVERLGVD